MLSKTFILCKTALFCLVADKFTTIFFTIINFKCISSNSRSSDFQNFPGKHAPAPPRNLTPLALRILPPQSKTYSACPSDACNVRSIKPTWVLYSHDCVFSYENVLFFSKVSCIFLLLSPKNIPNICSGGIIWWSIIPDTFETKTTLRRQGFFCTQLSGPVLAGGASMG